MNIKFLRIIFYSVQDAFIALFPYLIIRASATLFIAMNQYFQLCNIEEYSYIIDLLYSIFPLLLLLSISIQLSKNLYLNNTHFILISFFSFLFFSGYIEVENKKFIIQGKNVLVYAFIIPIIISIISNLGLLKLNKKILKVNRYNAFNDAYNYLLIYSFIFFNAILMRVYHIKSPTSMIYSLFSSFALEIQALYHLLLSHLMWLLGVHGTTSYRYIFDMDFYTQPIFHNLTYESFFSVFVIFGGAGSTLSLIIAILLYSNNKHNKIIAKASIPFAIFNINEPLIYGIPIAFNKQFIIPFITVPIINFICAYTFISFGFLSFENINVPWTTPPLFSGYLLTGSWIGTLYQFFIIVLGIFIYKPFLNKKRGRPYIGNDNQLQILKSVYNDSLRVHQDRTKEQLQIENDLNKIVNGKLLLYYQPQIDIRNNTVYGFEALLRLSENKQIHPPVFLDTIEKLHLEYVIDMWTVQELKRNMDLWEKSNKPLPSISINIYPKTLLDSKNINTIIHTLSKYNIHIELIEKGLRGQEVLLNRALNKLKDAGFLIAVDDFGSDESNLSLLGMIDADIIKLDRSLIHHSDTRKGLTLFKSSCVTFQDMDFTVIAEGIETEEELSIAKDSNVDIVQGWYYSKALPLKDAMAYKSTKESSKL